MVCAFYDEQFFVFAFEFFERIFSHVARVRVFAVDDHDRVFDFPREREQRIFMNESTEVLFQPSFELSERGWYPRGVL